MVSNKYTGLNLKTPARSLFFKIMQGNGDRTDMPQQAAAHQ
jgi:hypothetical protein